MGATEACIVCGLIGCVCRNRFVQYFELLEGAAANVSTLEDTSERRELVANNVVIDKVSLELAFPISQQQLLERLRPCSKPKLVKLRDRRWHLEIGHPFEGMYFALTSRIANQTNRLVTRPSAFADFPTYITHLRRVLVEHEIEEANISRLDLAIDYKTELKTLLHGFDFERKQTQVSFQDKNGRRTGLFIGRGSEKILVYDKAAESRLPMPMTRIEIQLSGNKLPTRKIAKLEDTLTNTSWNPYKQIVLYEVDLATNTQSLTATEQARHSHLSSLLEREGLFSARRVLNQQRNFWRDYGTVLNIHPTKSQPSIHYREKIKNFFQPTT